MGEAGVLPGPDPVLDPGVGAVPGFQDGQLPAGGVGGERWMSVIVTAPSAIAIATAASTSTRPGS